ncbi:hypothetical protein FAES_4046 [Fibrella aestuarina BUZ 2]|uniref:Uncharacterized protein n=1 Tax=Fibrella aestuarina BUZ 2 TaxID=1166018 RepID=I0KD43_9BACT|nr:hypothetical protein [Fibrella aestuarina]CCH02046.1 hypothetical protein FAES_4046 [Fibrella aestuarina BUZ 2]
MMTLAQNPALGAELLARYKLVAPELARCMELGMQQYADRYDLGFAEQKVLEAERLFRANTTERIVVTDDTAIRTREGYFHWMAETVSIHRNWPQYLLTSDEMDAWIRQYQHGINECNSLGYYFREAIKTHFAGPKWLAEKYNVHSRFYCLVDVAVLCKIRWYQKTQSRFHKPDRLNLYNQEFIDRVINWQPS